ncbi:uncharacterized protein BX663DRAFT_503469 [Cokeromyces recurvatus]|uniref:uncharacterized protein n=1 Tax=Cokeromyces recurvatus TaxID=90255 RepID=UPI00221F1EAE|nr:uncharacterized protein BX663DRAFT_503469 [Cokeromyces recurvatus]KAI7904762.1 hypothetical protein BX663DRAFT_503469 [Cokeromyces recurvatus]
MLNNALLCQLTLVVVKKKVLVRDKEDEDTTSSSAAETSDDDDDYDPGEDSDAGSILMMRSSRPHKVRSSIKKIEPTLLKTNSRSDQDSSDDDSNSDETSDDDLIIPTTSSNNAYQYVHKYRRNSKSSLNHNRRKSSNVDTWDAESADSDALVQHIIQVSKGKRPLGPRDPAADRMPTQPNVSYDNGYISTDGGMPPTKSDYDYEFDDDDWDTHSEHAEDVPYAFITEEYPPIAPAPPVGCQICKAPVNNEPVLPAVKPKVERCVSDTKATDDIYHTQQQYDSSNNDGSNNNNSTFFSSIAHWASSHLWPADKSN